MYPEYMGKIKAMFETTNQKHYSVILVLLTIGENKKCLTPPISYPLIIQSSSIFRK
jgi:hypothetical protein